MVELADMPEVKGERNQTAEQSKLSPYPFATLYRKVISVDYYYRNTLGDI